MGKGESAVQRATRGYGSAGGPVRARGFPPRVCVRRSRIRAALQGVRIKEPLRHARRGAGESRLVRTSGKARLANLRMPLLRRLASNLTSLGRRLGCAQLWTCQGCKGTCLMSPATQDDIRCVPNVAPFNFGLAVRCDARGLDMPAFFRGMRPSMLGDRLGVASAVLAVCCVSTPRPTCDEGRPRHECEDQKHVPDQPNFYRVRLDACARLHVFGLQRREDAHARGEFRSGHAEGGGQQHRHERSAHLYRLLVCRGRQRASGAVFREQQHHDTGVPKRRRHRENSRRDQGQGRRRPSVARRRGRPRVRLRVQRPLHLLRCRQRNLVHARRLRSGARQDREHQMAIAEE